MTTNTGDDMATLLELFNLRNDSDLKNRTAVAMAVRCRAIVDGTPTANQLAFATKVFNDPSGQADLCLKYLLAGYSDGATTTPAAITGATDAALQTVVTAYVNKFSA